MSSWRSEDTWVPPKTSLRVSVALIHWVNYSNCLLQRYPLPRLDAFTGRFRDYIIGQVVQRTELIVRSPFSPRISMRSILV